MPDSDSGILLKNAWGTILDTRDQMQMGCVQGKDFIYYTYYLFYS